MASQADKETAIQRTFPGPGGGPGEYNKGPIEDTARLLERSLAQQRAGLMASFNTSNPFQGVGVPQVTHWYPGNPSPNPTTNSSLSAMENVDGLYNGARSSYIYRRAQEDGTPSGDRAAIRSLHEESENTAFVPKVEEVRQIIRNEVQSRVESANLGSVEGSNYESSIGRNVVNALSLVFRRRSIDPDPETKVLQDIANNFMWAYYTLFQSSSATIPSNEGVFSFIRLEEFIQLFIRVRVRKVLLEAIETLEDEGRLEALIDPTLTQQSRARQMAEELLRQEANRIAQETYVPEREQGEIEEQSKLRRLAEQAFLIDFLPEFAEQNQTMRAPSYNNSSGIPYFSMLQGRTDTIMNQLLYNPALDNMDILRPSELAGLVPQIRLFKVFHDTETSTDDSNSDQDTPTYIEQEVPFDSHIQASEIDSMMSNAFDRGRGVGLKSFDWRLEGQNPFTARRDIFAELKLHFQSFDELLRERRLRTISLKDKARSFRYVDLVNIGVVRQTREGAWNPDYYKLRVEVGWADPGPNNSFLGNAAAREAKRNAILNSKMVMYLTAIDHTIDVNDQGNVSMTIEYVAWQEASYLDQDSDVLATEGVSRAREQRRAEIDRARASCNDDAVEAVIQRYKTRLRGERYSAYQRLLRTLYADRKIYFLPVAVSDLEGYINFGERGVNTRAINSAFTSRRSNQGPDIDFTNIANSRPPTELANVLGMNVGQLQEDGLLQAIQDLRYNADSQSVNVQYFYFGDLIKIALDQVSNSTPPQAGNNPSSGVVGKLQKDLRILLGPISFKTNSVPVRQNTPAQSQFVYNINLADIPISVNFFAEWFLKQVVSEQRTTYPILVFIRDLTNKLLTGILKNQAHGLENVARQNIQLRTNFFTAAAAATGADIIQDNFNIVPDSTSQSAYTRINLDNLPVGTAPLFRPPNDGERSYHYMVIYAINAGSTTELDGDYIEDNSRGIYHFGIGRDRGIFKSVKFTKTDLPGLRESRFSLDAEAAATGLTVLSNVYEIEMKMVGNTIFAPGMKIYLNPSGIAPLLGNPTAPSSPSRLLGIGGYHVVTGVRSYIESGVFETTVKAIFESPGTTGALGFSGAEQPSRRTDECNRGTGAQNIIRSTTPTQRAVNRGPSRN